MTESEAIQLVTNDPKAFRNGVDWPKYGKFEGVNNYIAIIAPKGIDGLVQEGDPGWFLEGFNGGYLNRYRGSLGVDIKLNRSSTLNFYLMGDYCIDKEVVLFHPILKVGQTIRIDDGSTERFLFRSLTDGDLVFVSFLDEKPQLFL